MDGRYGTHRYLYREGIRIKNQDIWRGVRRLWRIMTRNQRKKQGSEQKKCGQQTYLIIEWRVFIMPGNV